MRAEDQRTVDLAQGEKPVDALKVVHGGSSSVASGQLVAQKANVWCEFDSQDRSVSHGPWRVQRRSCVYKDPWLSVFQDDVQRPDGQSGSYSTSHIKPGVCVIALDGTGNVHLTKEFHYAVSRVTIEGVSGGIEDGESAEETALRELREEIGAIAGCLIPLGTVDPLTSSLCSPTQLFLAKDLSWTEPEPEGTETIERFSLPFEQVIQMVMSSEISHGPTCVALLKIQLLQCGNSLPE